MRDSVRASILVLLLAACGSGEDPDPPPTGPSKHEVRSRAAMEELLSLEVVNAAGEPVAGASVRPVGSEDPDRLVSTGDDGRIPAGYRPWTERYLRWETPESGYFVGDWEVYHPDYTPVVIPIGEGRPPRVTLTPAPPPEDRVTLRFTCRGRPVPDVAVSFRWSTSDAFYSLPSSNLFYAVRKTDDEGEIHLPRVPGFRGDFSLTVVDDAWKLAGYALEELGIGKDPPVALHLEPRIAATIELPGVPQPWVATVMPVPADNESPWDRLARRRYGVFGFGNGRIRREGETLRLAAIPAGTWRVRVITSHGEKTIPLEVTPGPSGPQVVSPWEPTPAPPARMRTVAAPDGPVAERLGRARTAFVFPARLSLTELLQVLEATTRKGDLLLGRMAPDAEIEPDPDLVMEVRQDLGDHGWIATRSGESLETKALLRDGATVTLLLPNGGWCHAEATGDSLRILAEETAVLVVEAAGAESGDRILVREVPPGLDEVVSANGSLGRSSTFRGEGPVDLGLLPAGRYRISLTDRHFIARPLPPGESGIHEIRPGRNRVRIGGE